MDEEEDKLQGDPYLNGTTIPFDMPVGTVGLVLGEHSYVGETNIRHPLIILA